MIGTPCNNCNGNGKVQSNENVTVKIPKGVDDGTRIRLSGKRRSRIKRWFKWRFISYLYQ